MTSKSHSTVHNLFNLSRKLARECLYSTNFLYSVYASVSSLVSPLVRGWKISASSRYIGLGSLIICLPWSSIPLPSYLSSVNMVYSSSRSACVTVSSPSTSKVVTGLVTSISYHATVFFLLGVVYICQ